MHRTTFPGAASIACAVALGAADAATGEIPDHDRVRALVAEMLADAESRSSLLRQTLGAGAGHDGRFFIASSDSDFRLNISGQLQFRYVATFRDDDAPSPGPAAASVPVDGFVSGFQNRRFRLLLNGHAIDPRLTYHILLDFNRSGGGLRTLEAFTGFDLGGGLSLRFGQFKLPFLFEELMSSRRLLAADRSLTNARFTQGFSQAVQLTHEDERLRLRAAFSDGFNSFNIDVENKPADWAVTGRIDWLAAGEWRQFNDFTSPRGATTGVLLGAAAHAQGAPDTGAGEPLSRFVTWTADASLQGDGFNAFGAVVGRHDTRLPGSDDSYAYLIQGGRFVSESVELFARWDHIFGGDDLRTLTAGLNWYLHGHAAKLTADVQWFLDDSIAAPGGGVGFLTPTDDDQVALRLQFQLLF